MKKVLSLMIVVAAAAMVSCAGKQAKQAETVELFSDTGEDFTDLSPAMLRTLSVLRLLWH